MIYDELLKEADDLDLVVKEKPLKGYKGRIKGNKIAIKNNILKVEKACILAEELGHYYTTVGNILNLNDIRNTKQELQARAWSYNKLVGINGIIKAFENRCVNLYEMAEYLDITAEFLLEAINYYRSKYGLSVKVDNYIVYFEPNLFVAKSFK